MIPGAPHPLLMSSGAPRTYATMAGAGNMALSNGDLTVTQNATTSWNTRLANQLLAGKQYFEFTLVSNPNNVIFGIVTSNFTAGAGKYISNPQAGTSSGGGYADAATAPTYNAIGAASGFTTVTAGDVIGVAVDVTAGSVWFRKNGTWLRGDPAAGTLPTLAWAGGGSWYAGVSQYTSGDSLTANFGATAFAHAAPSGFLEGIYQ